MKDIEINIGNKDCRVFGGPYRSKPNDFYGVKMAVEIDKPCNVNIPTRDFDVPNEAQLITGLIQTVAALVKGKKVYVGCMGGVGRTGLFLAALVTANNRAKNTSYTNTATNCINYVRRHYNPHAVETKQQEDYLIWFDTVPVTKAIGTITRNPWLKYLPLKWLTWAITPKMNFGS